ncbi:hypothetical protein LCGC14_1327370 [marine sediment metagenome]|uniref:Uncharacterized protein n=1 Tax=marine sediment metagenome TaxID=412755 RepID=A0A0F9L3I4_9ZZZZ
MNRRRTKVEVERLTGHDGKGADRKGTKRDGLRFKWQWIEQRCLSGVDESDRRRLPCQTCFAEVETLDETWCFRSVAWRNKGSFTYQAGVKLRGNNMISQDSDNDDAYCDTRLEAQRVAERMLEVLCVRALRKVYGRRDLSVESRGRRHEVD